MLSEQAANVARIERETAQIVAARGQIEREIVLAREWRQSLIAEAVTGQLRVASSRNFSQSQNRERE